MKTGVNIIKQKIEKLNFQYIKDNENIIQEI
jgi:hypothetical protein